MNPELITIVDDTIADAVALWRAWIVAGIFVLGICFLAATNGLRTIKDWRKR